MVCLEEVHFHQFPSRTHIYSSSVLEELPLYFVATQNQVYRLEVLSLEDREKWHIQPCHFDSYDGKKPVFVP